MTDEERAKKWLERTWVYPTDAKSEWAQSLAAEFTAAKKPLEDRIAQLEAELKELDGVLDASTDRVIQLLGVLQKADTLAFQSVAYTNLDKERLEYQEARRDMIGVPRLGVNAFKEER